MYRKTHASFWTDPKVRSLTPEGKLLFLYLFTNPHTHASGIYYLPAAFIAHETGLKLRAVDTLLHTLSDLGLARFDAAASEVWVTKMFRHQGRGAKLYAAAANQLENLHNVGLMRDFLQEYPEVNEYLSDGVSHRVADTNAPKEKEKEKEQKQEEEQKKEEETTSVALKHDNGRDIDSVFAHFQLQHPRARLGRKRRELIAARLKDGYTVDDLQLAIDGLHLDRWHNETNNLTLEYAIRNAEKIEKLQGIASDPSNLSRMDLPAMSEKTRGNVRASIEWLNRREVIDG